jgi:hypothetical protein
MKFLSLEMSFFFPAKCPAKGKNSRSDDTNIKITIRFSILPTLYLYHLENMSDGRTIPEASSFSMNLGFKPVGATSPTIRPFYPYPPA